MTPGDIMRMIDRATEPRQMSKADAVRFLEEIIEACDARVEAISEEARDDES